MAFDAQYKIVKLTLLTYLLNGLGLCLECHFLGLGLENAGLETDM